MVCDIFLYSRDWEGVKVAVKWQDNDQLLLQTLEQNPELKEKLNFLQVRNLLSLLQFCVNLVGGSLHQPWAPQKSKNKCIKEPQVTM